MRARCVSGLRGTKRHGRDRLHSYALLTRGNSTVKHGRAPPGKDPIPLLKRVSQVRIPPGTSRKASGPIMVRGLGELPEFRAHLALAIRSVP
jgi:hypothetical protein